MPRKATSPRISSAAARLLAKLPESGRITVVESLSPGWVMGSVVCTVAALRSLLRELARQEPKKAKRRRGLR